MPRSCSPFLIICYIVSLILVLSGSRPAHAGYWQITKCVTKGIFYNSTTVMILENQKWVTRIVNGKGVATLRGDGGNGDVDITADGITTLNYVRSAAELTYPTSVSVLLDTIVQVEDSPIQAGVVSDVPLLNTNLGDPLIRTPVYWTNSSDYGVYWRKSGKHVVSVPATNGVATVVFSAHVHDRPSTANRRCYLTYQFNTRPDPRSLLLYVKPSGRWTWSKNEPQDQILEAYAHLDWYDDGVLEHPLVPFYSGSSEFSFFANRTSVANSVLLLKNHAWTTSPDPYVPVKNPSDYDLLLMTVPPVNQDKNFHWNLGTDATALPLSSTTTVNATDPSDGAIFSAKAKINWHWAFEGVGGSDSDNSITQLPGSNVSMGDNSSKPIQQVQVGDKIKTASSQMRQTVQSITTNPDTSITLHLGLDPDDNPADPAYDLNTQITRLSDAHLQAQHTGARYVKLGLEAYTETAKMLAMGPLSEMGGAALGTLAEEAGGLLNAAREAEKVAQADATLAAEARTIAAEARQAEQGLTDVQQVAALEQKAVDAGQKATQLEAEAAEATSLANQSEKLAVDAEEGIVEVGGGAEDVGLPSGVNPGSPGSPEHKALRWAAYQANPNNAGWGYSQWSKVYDLNMTRAKIANAAGDAYGATLGWGRSQVAVFPNGIPRILDWADTALTQGIEYKNGYTVASEKIQI